MTHPQKTQKSTLLIALTTLFALGFGACKPRASMVFSARDQSDQNDEPKTLIIVLNSETTIQDAEKIMRMIPGQKFSFVNLGQTLSYDLKKRPVCNVSSEIKNEVELKYEKSIQILGNEITKCLEKLKEEGSEMLVADADENYIEAVALARSALNLKGLDLKHSRYFRDKFVMKEKLRSSGVKVPKFVSASILQGEALAAETKYPIVLKPRTSQGSIGVKFIQNKGELVSALAKIPSKDLAVWELEEAIDHPILHIDFAAENGQLKYLSASQYLVTAFEFYQNQKAVATILINDAVQLASFRNFAKSIMQGLDHGDGVFHLEAFQAPNRELTFLEVAHRTGGSLIAEVVKNVHDVDLPKAHLLLQLGYGSRVYSDPTVSEAKDKSGGLMVLPIPKCPPKRKAKLDYSGQGKNFETILETSFNQVNAKRMRETEHAAEFIFKGSYDAVKTEMDYLLANLKVKCE